MYVEPDLRVGPIEAGITRAQEEARRAAEQRRTPIERDRLPPVQEAKR